MSMKQRLYRDSSGPYYEDGSGSYVEFTLPVKTSNIEKQVYGLDIVRHEQIDIGDSYSVSMIITWQYWNGSTWVSLFEDQTVYMTGSAEDDVRRTHCYSSSGTFTSETFRAKMEELNGKRVRWFSKSREWLNDTNAEATHYLELWTYYNQPVIGDVTFTRDFVNEAVNLNVPITNVQGYSISLNGNTYTNTKSIPESAFVIGNNTISIYVYNGDMKASKTVSYNFVDYNPVAKSVSFTNSTLDNATNIEVTSSNAQRYDLYVNGVYKYTSSTQIFTPPLSAFSIGENVVFVRCYNTTSGRYADTSTYKKVMSLLKPTVSNILVINDGYLIDNETTISWQSSYQNNFNIYANDVLIASGGAKTTCTIPKGKFKAGNNKIRVEVIKSAISGISDSRLVVYYDVKQSFTRLEPTVSNITLSSTNIDEAIKVKWDSTYQTYAEVYQGNNKVAYVTSASEVDLIQGKLKAGNSAIKVVVYYESGFDTISSEYSIDVTLTCDMPIIYNLEPSNLNKNIHEIIKVTFKTNIFCDRWELKANTTQITGTTQREISIGSNTFVKGTNTLTLTIYYSPSYDKSIIRTATKTVTFNGYGNPDAPILDDIVIYNTSIPSITWKQTEEQEGYAYELYKGESLLQSNTVDSTEHYFTLSTLEDKSSYTIKVKIKNKYDLYSEWSIKNFETSFSDIIVPEFNITTENNKITIVIDGLQDTYFKKLCIYRRTKYEDWVMIADDCNVIDTIVDYAYAANVDTEYKLRVYNTYNGYADSKIITIKNTVLNYMLSNVEDFSQSFTLDFVTTSIETVRNIKTKVYSGSKAPRAFKGKTFYDVISLRAELDNEAAYDFVNWLEAANEYNVFLYRNWKGEKKYCVAIYEGMTPVNSMVMAVSLKLTEISFIEEKLYSGSGYKKIVYLDGSYFLDGSVDLSEYDTSVIAPYTEVMSLEEI